MESCRLHSWDEDKNRPGVTVKGSFMKVSILHPPPPDPKTIIDWNLHERSLPTPPASVHSPHASLAVRRPEGNVKRSLRSLPPTACMERVKWVKSVSRGWEARESYGERNQKTNERTIHCRFSRYTLPFTHLSFGSGIFHLLLFSLAERIS